MIIFITLNLQIKAQSSLPQVDYYYVEESSTNFFRLSEQERLADHSLVLNFYNEELDAFFSLETVYVFKKAFPGAINSRLQNMYLIGLDRDDAVNDLRNLNNVVYVDFIGDITPQPLSTPNDYNSDVLIPTLSI